MGLPCLNNRSGFSLTVQTSVMGSILLCLIDFVLGTRTRYCPVLDKILCYKVIGDSYCSLSLKTSVLYITEQSLDLNIVSILDASG